MNIAGAAPSLLAEHQFVFMPINNNQGNKVGGSHWSLLVLDRLACEFWHFDSVFGLNTKISNFVATQVSIYYGLGPSPRVIQKQCPQQTNASDCGVFVIAICDYLSKRIADGMVDCVQVTLDEHEIAEWRVRLADLICKKAK
jgi:sentrin-specific protease 8